MKRCAPGLTDAEQEKLQRELGVIASALLDNCNTIEANSNAPRGSEDLESLATTLESNPIYLATKVVEEKDGADDGAATVPVKQDWDHLLHEVKKSIDSGVHDEKAVCAFQEVVLGFLKVTDNMDSAIRI